jgi:hypothetical protein
MACSVIHRLISLLLKLSKMQLLQVALEPGLELLSLSLMFQNLFLLIIMFLI